MSSHKHMCPVCGFIWRHPNAVADAGRKTLKAAHTCPKCGCHQNGLFSTYELYNGKRRAHKAFRSMKAVAALTARRTK